MIAEKPEDIKTKVMSEPDFINSKKYRYSMDRYLKNNPTSPDNIIAHLLCMSEDEVEEVFNNAVIKIRQFMKIQV